MLGLVAAQLSPVCQPYQYPQYSSFLNVGPVLYTVDRCRNLGQYCGQEAANIFCERNNYTVATQWNVAPFRFTLTAAGEECDARNIGEAECLGFVFVLCCRTTPQDPKLSVKHVKNT